MDDLSADLGKPTSAGHSLDLSAQSNRKPRREKTFTVRFIHLFTSFFPRGYFSLIFGLNKRCFRAVGTAVPGK